MEVRQFADSCEISQALVVREVEVRQRRDGAEYIKIVLGDRTGSVPAMVWEEVERTREVCTPGKVVYVIGRYSVHQRYGPQLAIQSVRAAAPDEYAAEELEDGPARSA